MNAHRTPSASIVPGFTPTAAQLHTLESIQATYGTIPVGATDHDADGNVRVDLGKFPNTAPVIVWIDPDGFTWDR